MIDHPGQVESELVRLSALLEERTGEFAMLAERAARSEAAHKRANARALLSSDAKTVGDREAEALIACGDAYTDRLVDAALADAARESCRSIRTQLDALRSLNANVRNLTGSDQTPRR